MYPHPPPGGERSQNCIVHTKTNEVVHPGCSHAPPKGERSLIMPALYMQSGWLARLQILECQQSTECIHVHTTNFIVSKNPAEEGRVRNMITMLQL